MVAGTLIAHITDAHVATAGRPTACLKHRSQAVLADLVAQLKASGVDGVLFGGDNIDNRGHGEADLEAFLKLVEPIEGRWMAQFGNHEASTGRPGRIDKYAFAAAVAGRGVGPGRHDFSERVGDVRVIGIDTTLIGSPAGFVSPETMRFLRHEIESATEPHVVVVGHHPLHPAWAPFHLDSWEREYLVANRQPVIALLAAAPRVRAYFCGHHHGSRIQRVGGRSADEGFYQLQTASPVAFPHTSRLVRFTAEAMHVRPLVPRIEGLIEEGAEAVRSGRKAQRFQTLGAEIDFLRYLSGGRVDNEAVLPFDGRLPARPERRFDFVRPA